MKGNQIMNNENNKDMKNEEAEQKFKDAVFEAFAAKNPGVHRDEDGFIVVPMRVRRRKPQNDNKNE